jgi:hypothetical protein
MKNSKTEERDFRRIADEFDINAEDVKNIVNSFFDTISSESRKLPFDNPRKIYSKAVFDSFASSRINNIPYIGRIGPVYSRYLKWRANEAKGIEMIPRQRTKKKLTQEEIEAVAEIVLKGGTYVPDKKRNNNFKRIWMVGEDGKKSAGQVIPKKKEDVYD